MSDFIGKTFILGCVFTTSTFVSADILPVHVKHVFIPNGFDNNDNVQVVVAGTMPGDCYKLDAPRTTVDHANQTIHISLWAKGDPTICLPFEKWYTQTIDVGTLKTGSYSVMVARGDMSARFVDVAESENLGPDDYTYAEIINTYIDFAPDYAADSRWSVVLEGRYPGKCQTLDRIEVIDSDDTIEVLPIVKDLETDAQCSTAQGFIKRAYLPEFLYPGHRLLHVRSYNGAAKNHVFMVP